MANYTINEIPDTAPEVGNSDLAVVWQNNATKKISILNFFKNLVKKSEVTNTVSALSESVITSKGVSSLLTIPAGNTTITNAPPLQNNATYRFFFTSQITGSDDTTAMTISYNGTTYSIKATSNGSLKDFTAYPIATEQTRELKKGEKSEEEKSETKVETKSETRATVTTYVYCQAYTTLEMMFDGTKFIIMGNPVVISNSDYTIYADGLKIYHQFSDRPYYWGKYVSSYSQGANYLYYILNNLGLNPTGIGTYRLFIKDTQSTACAEYFVHYQHGTTITLVVDFELEMHLNAYNSQGTMDFSNISSYSNLQCYVEIISVY